MTLDTLINLRWWAQLFSLYLENLYSDGILMDARVWRRYSSILVPWED